jgi:hypothetical protein
MDKTLDQLGAQRGGRMDARDVVTNQGQVMVNCRPQDAAFSDMFRGEETGNAALLDIGKMQLFLITLLLAVTYASALAAVFAGGGAIHAFPPLDQSSLALLGLSNGAYLTDKAAPHSQPAV